MTLPQQNLENSEHPFGQKVRQRIFSRNFQQQVMMFVLMLLFGIILMNHIQTVRANARSNDIVETYKQRQAELVRYKNEYDSLLAENEKLNLQKTAAIADLLNQQGNENLLAELQHIRVLAGFTEVRGPGITLVLDDKPDYDILTDSLDSIVHDGDIIHALELLKDSGAAAIGINGLRITNSTYILCNSATIICNEQRLTPPFIITARGDPAIMAEVIRNDQQFNIRRAKGIDLVVRVTVENEIVIPPFNEADNYGKYIDQLEVVAP